MAGQQTVRTKTMPSKSELKHIDRAHDKVTKLDRIIALAQQDADRTGNTLLIFNLNPCSPLYVIRNFTVAGANSRELVRVVTPGGVS
jgi:hypothetical protein